MHHEGTSEQRTAEKQSGGLGWVTVGAGIAALAGAAALWGRPGRRINGTLSDRRAAAGQVRVVEAVTLNAPLETVEERWATLESMPDSLLHLSRIQGSGEAQAIVEFRGAPGGRGTEVRVEVTYRPRSAAARAMTRLFGGDPTGQLRQDLRRFKAIVETGEVLLAEGPAMWRPGQPARRPQEIRNAAGLGV